MKKDIPRFVAKLPGSFALFFVAKDFLAFLFFAKREPSVQNALNMRMALLPGSFLFDGFSIWFAPVFNALLGALLGWFVSVAYRRLN